MVSEQQLIAYLDDTLDAGERSAVEETLTEDPSEGLGVLVSQRRLDAALRAVLADEEAIQRMKGAILAAAGAPSPLELKSRVLQNAALPARRFPGRSVILGGVMLLLLVFAFSSILSRRPRPAPVTSAPTPVMARASATKEGGLSSHPVTPSSFWDTPIGSGARYELIDRYSFRANVRPVGVRSISPEAKGLAMHGASALGGVIRRGELQHGIKHALAISYNRSGLNQRGPGGRPFVWPAEPDDPTVAAHFGTQGNIYLGSLLAIPPEIDIGSLGLGQEGPALVLARALQDYGAYIVESSDTDWMDLLVADSEPLGEQVAPIWQRLAHELEVVTNNTPATPGGGGRPRGAAASPPDR